MHFFLFLLLHITYHHISFRIHTHPLICMLEKFSSFSRWTRAGAAVIMLVWTFLLTFRPFKTCVAMMNYKSCLSAESIPPFWMKNVNNILLFFKCKSCCRWEHKKNTLSIKYLSNSWGYFGSMHSSHILLTRPKGDWGMYKKLGLNVNIHNPQHITYQKSENTSILNSTFYKLFLVLSEIQWRIVCYIDGNNREK